MNTNRHFLDIEGRNARVPRAGVLIAAVLLVLVFLIFLHTWSRSSGDVSPIEILLGTPQAASRDVTVVSQDGVTVYMPAGATDLDGALSIAVAAPGIALVADDTEWTLLKVVRIEFRRPNGTILPDITFDEPLEICFHLTAEQWQAFMQSPDSYRVQYYAERQGPARWEVLPQVTHADKLQLCGQAHHLSVFGLAVHAPPVIPVTGGMAPAPAREEQEPVSVSAPEEDREDPPPADPAPTQPAALQPQPTDPPAEPAVEPPAPDQGGGSGNQGNGNEGNGNEDRGNGNEDKDNEGRGNGNGGNGNGGGGNGNGNGGNDNGGGGNGNGGNGNRGRGNGEGNDP